VKSIFTLWGIKLQFQLSGEIIRRKNEFLCGDFTYEIGEYYFVEDGEVKIQKPWN